MSTAPVPLLPKPKKQHQQPAGGGATDKKTDAPLLPTAAPRTKKPSHVSITVLDPVPATPAPAPAPATPSPSTDPVKKKAPSATGPSVAALASGIAALEPILWIVCSLLVTVACGAMATPNRPPWLRALTASVALLVEAYFLFVMVLWRNYAAGAVSNRWIAVAAAVTLAFAANALFLFQQFLSGA